VAVAHRRAGKTVACVQKLIRGALKCPLPQPRFAYVAPLYTQAKDVAWEYTKSFALKLSAIPHETELRVDLPNGARIRLYGADNPDRLRGLYLDGVILDEYADMRPSVWGEVIRPMLTDRKGWGTFIGTPKGHNGFYQVWRDAQVDDGWFSVMLKASETGLLSPDELADARKSMSEDQYLQEFECSFEAAIQGAYFATQMRKAREEGRLGKVPIDPGRPVNTFWDIGKSDSTSIWFHQNRGQMHHLVDYYESSGEGVEFYAKVLRDKQLEHGWQYGAHYGPHDLDHSHWVLPGRETVKDAAYELGIVFVVVPRIANKADAIEAGRNFLSMCWIDQQRCAKGIEALDHYRKEWDEDRKTWKAKAEHDWASHGADAMMTGACGFTPEFIPPPTDRYKRTTPRKSAWAA
jgi:phage terminase large subunit